DRGEAGVQIWSIGSTGGEPELFVSHKSPIQDFEWSPDGRFIAFLAEEPLDKPKTKPPIVVDEDRHFAQLWIFDVATRQMKQLTRGPRHITAFNWDPLSSRIVFTARLTPRLIDNNTTDVYVVATDLHVAPYDTANA